MKTGNCNSHIGFTGEGCEGTGCVTDQLLLYMKKRITDYYIAKNESGKCILTFDELVEQIVVDYHEKIDSVIYLCIEIIQVHIRQR